MSEAVLQRRMASRCVVLWLMLCSLTGCGRRTEAYKTAKSPDGLWSAALIRDGYGYALIEGCVDVILEIRDESGAVVYRRRIDNVDLWSDAEDRYAYVRCTNEEIVVGPYNPRSGKLEDFVLKKDEVFEGIQKGAARANSQK